MLFRSAADTIRLGLDDPVGTITFKGATVDTQFDFSGVGPTIQNSDGSWTQGITSANLSFDIQGNLTVDVSQTGAHLVLIGMPFDDVAGLNAEIAAGAVVLNHTFG